MADSETRAPLVAGVDGTDGGRRAVEWAVAEGQRRDVPVRLVHAFEYPPALLPFYESATELGAGHLRSVAEQALATEVARTREEAPGVSVDGVVRDGTPVEVLLAEPARLVVVGTRGLSGFGGLVVGSTGTALAGGAACPAVVVPADRPAPRATGPVVVGVDGSADSEAAVGFAFDTASFRRAPLVALHAWRPSPGGLAEPPARLRSADAVARSMLVSEALAGCREKYPDVPVRDEVVRGHPVRALLEAVPDPSLLVLGARGTGGYPGLLLGSVAQGVLHNAIRPVAVVHA